MKRGASDEAERLVIEGYEALAADPTIDPALLAATRQRVVDATGR
jgi:hypothetical protein